jgi:hypothetical protein
MKRTLELAQVGALNGVGVGYRVVKLTNTVEPCIGEYLSTSEVKEFIRRPGWTVVIKKGNGE